MEKVKCSECTHMESYITGRDEYPPCTGIVYCSAGHWENGDPRDSYDDEIECIDYKAKQNNRQ